MTVRVAELGGRSVVAVTGAEAPGFLNGLVTAEVETLAEGTARYAALLTPQGKILFDFLALRTADGFLLDVAGASAADLAKRLKFYRLRAKIEIVERGEAHRVLAFWGGPPPEIAGTVYADPRLAALGHRAIVATEAVAAAFAAPGCEPAGEADWQAHRIALGVPEGGLDFPFGDAFPHDADMDDLGGVDFAKGCYVGQEVVSRMKHRGTARRRVLVARAAPGSALPPAGTDMLAGAKTIGTLGSSAGAQGLALVRADRAKEAMDAGQPIRAGEVELTLALPDWARFGWPASAGD